MLPENRPASVSDILKQIADRMQVLDTADAAFEIHDPAAAELYASVDCSHGEILQCICGLTEEQADTVEPALTQLEIRLFRDRIRP